MQGAFPYICAYKKIKRWKIDNWNCLSLDTPQSNIYYEQFCGQGINATVSYPNVHRSNPPRTLFLSLYLYLFL